MRASPIMCSMSLLADPSTPIPTFTPASSISRIGAIPDPSRMFDDGQCATPVPVSAIILISSEFTHTECAHHTSGPVHPTLSMYAAGRIPTRCIQKVSSSRVSATCVCSITPLYDRASLALCFNSSPVTENGEHGASATRSMEYRSGSW